MAIHELKLAPGWFDAVADGRKTFEVRRDDRGFAVGDTLCMREYDGTYSGRRCCAEVAYILKGEDFPDGIRPGYVVMGIRMLEGCSEGCDALSPLTPCGCRFGGRDPEMVGFRLPG